MSIKFGTDGWRAVIGEDFTFENVKIVSQAIAYYIKRQRTSDKRQGVVVGYDTRFMGREFAEAVAKVLTDNRIKVFLSNGPTSTPALSLGIKQNKLIGGIMVTASHNPPHYSGIKYKADYAGPAGPEIIKTIESFLGKGSVWIVSKKKGQETDLPIGIDLNKPHIKFLKSYIDTGLLKKSRFKVLVDIMYGAGDHLFEKVLEDTGCKIETIHADLNPGFAGTPPEPIERNLGKLINMVKKGRYNIGLATDGDADRIGVVSSSGKYITSSQVIALLLVHFVEDKGWTGAVVKTTSGSLLIDEIAKAYKLKLHETPVGFKHICKLMRSGNVLIGGEESGGLGFKNYVPERDGTLAGLLLLEMMACRKKSISQILRDIEKRFGKFVQGRIDLKFSDDKKARLFSQLASKPPKSLVGEKILWTRTNDGIKLIGKDKSWLLFRASGTEPILRIYCESSSDAKMEKLLKFGKSLALKA
ncbi:MAG: phosphoglucomutase/phosphomannomutase family protein [Candidatus Omnitrophica bacterium]|nr:phosphoglucomutase/phosphomannomutase family protein [Candidatus Omnitrophota bacterium]